MKTYTVCPAVYHVAIGPAVTVEAASLADACVQAINVVAKGTDNPRHTPPDPSLVFIHGVVEGANFPYNTTENVPPEYRDPIPPPHRGNSYQPADVLAALKRAEAALLNPDMAQTGASVAACESIQAAIAALESTPAQAADTDPSLPLFRVIRRHNAVHHYQAMIPAADADTALTMARADDCEWRDVAIYDYEDQEHHVYAADDDTEENCLAHHNDD